MGTLLTSEDLSRSGYFSIRERHVADVLEIHQADEFSTASSALSMCSSNLTSLTHPPTSPCSFKCTQLEHPNFS